MTGRTGPSLLYQIATDVQTSAKPVITIVFFKIKKYNLHDGTPSSTPVLDMGPTHACTEPPSSAPATAVYLHHQLRQPHIGALPPAREHRLHNHHHG
jgi:hypothetical protein